MPVWDTFLQGGMAMLWSLPILSLSVFCSRYLCCWASLCCHTVTHHLPLFQMGEVLPLGLRLGEAEMDEF